MFNVYSIEDFRGYDRLEALLGHASMSHSTPDQIYQAFNFFYETNIWTNLYRAASFLRRSLWNKFILLCVERHGRQQSFLISLGEVGHLEM